MSKGRPLSLSDSGLAKPTRTHPRITLKLFWTRRNFHNLLGSHRFSGDANSPWKIPSLTQVWAPCPATLPAGFWALKTSAHFPRLVGSSDNYPLVGNQKVVANLEMMIKGSCHWTYGVSVTRQDPLSRCRAGMHGLPRWRSQREGLHPSVQISFVGKEQNPGGGQCPENPLGDTQSR